MKRKTNLILAAVLAAIIAYTALSRGQFIPQKNVSSAQLFSASSMLTEENIPSEPDSAEIVSQPSSEEPIGNAVPSSLEAPAPSSQKFEEPPEESSSPETSQPAASSSNPPKESSSDTSASSQRQDPDSTTPPFSVSETLPADTQKSAEQPVQTPVTETPAASPATSSSSSEAASIPSADTSFAGEIIRLVNIERTKAGLAALTEDTGLDKTANIKARDMVMNDYFDHVSPSGVSPFDLMDANGIQYHYAGENIAMGYPTPSSVMEAWMNSEGHRENILNAHYTRIGIGIFQDTNGAYYWVQHFAG